MAASNLSFISGIPMSDKIQQQLAQAERYARAGSYADAQKTLRQVIDKARANVGAWLLLGQVCGMQNAHSDAEQAFAQAARLNPRSLDAQAYLGLACMKQGKDEQAVARIQGGTRYPAAPGDGAGQSCHSAA